MKKLLLIILSITMLFAGCTKEKEPENKLPKITTASLSFKAGESQQILLTPNSDGCSFSMAGKNDIAASVTSSGEFFAKRIGECSVSVTKNGTQIGIIKISVTPKYNFYIEPYFGFGSSMSSVISSEKRKLKSCDTADGLGILLYESEHLEVDEILYQFKAAYNSERTYFRSTVYVRYSPQNKKLLEGFLEERYILSSGSSSESLIFRNKDLNVFGSFFPSTSSDGNKCIFVSYGPYEPITYYKSIDSQSIE